MKTVYVTQEQYDKLPTIHQFPNPIIKRTKIDDELCHVSVAGEITIQTLSEEDCKYYGLLPNSFILTNSLGHFPTELVMTSKNRYYTDGNNWGCRVGKNLGTATIGVTELEPVIKVLEENNFTIKNKSYDRKSK